MDDAHEGQRLVVDRSTGDAGGKDLPRFWTSNRSTRPLVRDGSQMNFQLRPHDIEKVFQMLHHLAGVGGQLLQEHPLRAGQRNDFALLLNEAARQVALYEGGDRVVQETRLFDSGRGETRSMRAKEFAHDYRYFPEPDLPPLDLPAPWVEEIRAGQPELPAARRRRFVDAHGLTAHEAELLCQGRGLADYFEAAVRAHPRPKTVANWVLNELLRELPGDDDRAIAACPIAPASLGGLLALVEDGTISGKIAKDVFEKMYRSGEDARTIVAREGLTQVVDTGALGAVVDQVLAAHPQVIEDWRGGKKAALGFLVGQVMKSTQGKANPALVNRLLGEKLPKL